MAAPAVAQPQTTEQVTLPNPQALLQASKIAIEQDRPILLDYYVETVQGRAFIGEDETTHEKMLVKSSNEYTSLVQKMYKVGNDILVLTENSIYIVSGALKKRKIQASNYLSNE